LPPLVLEDEYFEVAHKSNLKKEEKKQNQDQNQFHNSTIAKNYCNVIFIMIVIQKHNL